MANEWDNFKKFVLNNKPYSEDKILLKHKLLTKKINAIVQESRTKQLNSLIDIIQIEFEKSKQNLELSEHLGSKELDKELEKFKKEFFFDLKKKLTRLR